MIYIGYDEEWKQIILENNVKTHYSVSNLGRVRNDDSGRILKYAKINNSKYHYVILSVDGKTTTKTISRLVARAFIPVPKKIYQARLHNG